MKRSEIIVFFLLLVCGTAALHAAEAAKPVLTEDQIIPTASHAWDLIKELLTVLGSLAIAGRAYYARVKSGASAIGIFSAIVFGTNSPAPKSDTKPSETPKA